jgi:hypothetical protein
MNKVKECMNLLLANEQQHATLEFYHIVTPALIQEIATVLIKMLPQTAQQMVVVVVRKDLWRQRAQSNIDYLKHCTT